MNFKLLALTLLSGLYTLSACQINKQNEAPTNKELRYKIAVCDWMILKRQKLGAFDRTKEIGADGFELDLGGLGTRITFDNKLRDPLHRKAFLCKSDETDIEISSIAMSGFYAQNFAQRDGIEVIMNDAINTMVMMNVKTAFLPLGVEGDLIKYPERRNALVKRLMLLGEKAEAAGVIIGIETAYGAAEEVHLLDEIGSPAIKSYFNFGNAVQNHRDICQELKIYGKDRIAMIHASGKDSVWLENDPYIDLPQIKETLDDMGWSGWLVIERSRDASQPRNVIGNYSANVAYLKKVFQGQE
jgi:sugar phosphate isomerase/epimerase